MLLSRLQLFHNFLMFEKVLVKKPKRARFDFSHGNTLSMQFGRLTPTEIRFIVPGDDVAVSMEQIVRVAPLPVPTFVNMKVRHDWFFVPLSMMYNQQALDLLFGQNPTSYNRARVDTLTTYIGAFSGIDINTYGNPCTQEPFVPGSIHDFLNLPVFTDVNMTQNGSLATAFNDFMSSPTAAYYTALITDPTVKAITDAMPGPVLEPLLAYHYIWRDWYRFTGMDATNSGVVPDYWLENHIFNPSFVQSPVIGANPTWNSYNAGGAFYHGPNTMNSYLGIPYNAYLKKDMFTSARFGNKPQVVIPTGANGTIPNLRTASALQKFIDLIAVAGARYWDKVKSIWNETPSGMKCERAQFLGRYLAFVKIGEVITTANTADGTTGDYAGRGMLVDGKYIFKRHFTEHGWLMCISSIVPEMAYNGYDRQLTDVNMMDTPIPSFANIGDQSVLGREIRVLYTNQQQNNVSFGDQFRYYAYKSDVNRVHGDFLMRSFSPWTAIIPADQYLNFNARDYSYVDPLVWNKVFESTRGRDPFFNGRFYVDLTFHEFVTRNLPKYVSYAL